MFFFALLMPFEFVFFQTMQSTARMTAAIGTTTKTMQAVNKQMDPQKMAKTMQDFGKANMQMEMGEEMS